MFVILYIYKILSVEDRNSVLILIIIDGRVAAGFEAKEAAPMTVAQTSFVYYLFNVLVPLYEAIVYGHIIVPGAFAAKRFYDSPPVVYDILKYITCDASRKRDI